MKLPLLGALLLVLHAYLRQPTCSLINWTGRGAITHYLAWALSPQIRIRSSEQTHSTRGILPGGTHDFRTLPFSTDPAELVHPPYSFTARFVFLAFALPYKQGGGNQVTFR